MLRFQHPVSVILTTTVGIFSLLPCFMETANGQVCDVGQQVKLTLLGASALDQFGFAVSISGNALLVGVQGEDLPGEGNAGAAYVYIGSGPPGSQTWTQQGMLTAADANIGDTLGFSVAIDGDTAIVAAPFDDDNGSASGSAYIFIRSNGIWTQQAKLTSADSAPGDRFGEAVAIYGDTAVVGVWRDATAAGVEAGSAYVFRRENSIWTLQQQLLASDAAGSDQFGRSVAVGPDTIMIGTPGQDLPGAQNTGSVYVFAQQAGVWTQQVQLVISTPSNGNAIGRTVSLSGDFAVFGSYAYSLVNAVAAGSVFVFARNSPGSAWQQQAWLTHPAPAAADHFGSAVCISGDHIIVGAPDDDHSRLTENGSTFVFVRNGNSWLLEETLTTPDAEANWHFGQTVAISDSTPVVGMPFDHIGVGIQTGSVFVFGRDCPGACCVSGVCNVELQSQCSSLGGTYQGEGTTCAAVVCTLPCPADVSGNNTVDIDDLVLVITNWGATGGPADITGNGIVDIDDLVAVIINWGACP